MNTDGFVKVNGEEFSAKLIPNLEKLQFMIDWQDALNIEHNKRADEAYRKRQEKVKRVIDYRQTKMREDIENTFSEFTTWVPEFFEQVYFLFFTRTVESKKSFFDAEGFAKKLISCNPEFWSEVAIERVLSKKGNTADKFISRMDDWDNYGLGHYHHRSQYRSNYDREYMNERIKPFMNLKGEVFLSIDNYNHLNKFINEYPYKNQPYLFEE